MKRPIIKKRIFDVHIPSLDGGGIAEVVPIRVEVTRDRDTGEEVLTPESLELIEKTKARRMGLLLPVEIRGIRERLNLTQEQLAGLLQLGAKTLTRWESGRDRPSRSMNMLLLALRDGRIDVEYLRQRRAVSYAEIGTRGEPKYFELREGARPPRPSQLRQRKTQTIRRPPARTSQARPR